MYLYTTQESGLVLIVHGEHVKLDAMLIFTKHLAAGHGGFEGNINTPLPLCDAMIDS